MGPGHEDILSAVLPDPVLQILLGRTPVQDFFSTLWETGYLWVEERDNPFLKRLLPGLLTLETIDALLSTVYACGRRPVDSVTLVQEGMVLPPESYQTSRIGDLAQLDVSRVIDLHHQGASMALNSLHRTWEPIAALCRHLSQYFGSPCHANAYITPPRSQGFSLHYDTHDVYLIQVAGRKTWHLVGSTQPLSTEIFQDSDVTKATGPRSTVELTAGDVLYIPRGMFHEGITSDRMSAHLTIGVHPYTWASLLRDTVTALERDSVDFRRSATQPWNRTALSSRQFRDILNVLGARLTDSRQATAVLAGASWLV